MVRHYGFSDALGTVNLSEDEKISTDTLHLIESEVRSLVEGAQARAMMLLKTKSEELKRLAEALIVYESLNLDVRDRLRPCDGRTHVLFQHRMCNVSSKARRRIDQSSSVLQIADAIATAEQSSRPPVAW